MEKITKINNSYFSILLILLIPFFLYSCKSAEEQILNVPPGYESNEYIVREIHLIGPVSKNESEISGLSWFGDNLILLCQFPSRFGTKEVGAIFKINKSKLSNFINNIDTTAIEPEKVKVHANGLEKYFGLDQGFESIAFLGNDVYLTIEAFENKSMLGYIVKGKINDEASDIYLDEKSLKPIYPQASIYNLSDETIFIYNNQIYTLYECNGKNINPKPYAHKFDAELKTLEKVEFPNVEFRITDASMPSPDGKFWAINYMYQGDWSDLNPADDLQDNKYESQKIKESRMTERLLEFQIKEGKIIRTEKKPLKIKLLNNNIGRNWEGLAKMEEYGFLIVSDYFPRTILGFIDFRE